MRKQNSFTRERAKVTRHKITCSPKPEPNTTEMYFSQPEFKLTVLGELKITTQIYFLSGTYKIHSLESNIWSSR